MVGMSSSVLDSTINASLSRPIPVDPSSSRDKHVTKQSVSDFPDLAGEKPPDIHDPRCSKPLWPSSFPTLIFLVDTFVKLFVDSSVITIYPNLLAIE